MSEDSFKTWKMMMEARREGKVSSFIGDEVKISASINTTIEAVDEPVEEPGYFIPENPATIHFPYGTASTNAPEEYVSFGTPNYPTTKKRPATNLIDPTVKTSVKSKPTSPLPKKRNSLEGVLEKVDGQILKLFLTRRRSFVIGWFDFVEENFRQLMLMHRFTSSGGITIYARETPAMDISTILIPGIRKDGDEGHILYQFRNTEDATEYFFKYLEAFEELSALVRGKPKPDSSIGTKFNIPYTHVF